MTLGEVVRRSRVVVCVGPGGAGKTTVSAAVALQGVADGRRTLALTIDPAPRLASALEARRTAGNESVAVGRERLLDAGVPASGSLDVMVLDVKAAFDDLVSRLSPDDVTRRRILSNRYYRVIADSLAGSHEFMALELLRTTVDRGRYDLVVLARRPPGGSWTFFRRPRGSLSCWNRRRWPSWPARPPWPRDSPSVSAPCGPMWFSRR